MDETPVPTAPPTDAPAAEPTPEPTPELYSGPVTLLTPEVAAAIVDAVEAGNYVETAVRAAGIALSTYYKWMKRGREEAERVQAGGKPRKREAPYWEFFNAVEDAHARAEQAIFTQIRVASRDVWQAGAWILERKYPAKYGQRIQFTIEQELGTFMQKLQAKLQPHEYERVLEAMASESMGALPVPAKSAELPAIDVTPEAK